jgi:serine/threonine protein kinase
MDKSRFGPFALEDRLGDDPACSVYRALHLQQRKMVALKVFAAPLVASSPAARAALVREVEILKKLQHPNIARCFGGLLEDSQGCIAWELVEGETLSALLARRGRLSWETVVEYAMQISSALEHAHAAGVVHQDLTPEKILVAPNDQIKVIDFRCDRATNPTCASSQRRTVERARYLSPEQLRGDTALNHKADLYMLGCMMFEMLVGHPPFDASTIDELAQLHQDVKPPRVDALVLDCPVWLDSLIGQLLDPDPLRRPYSASAVTTALAETHKKMAAKTSVLEHAAGGFSALQRTTDQTLARDLLRKARRESVAKKKSQSEKPPFWESAWFLALCLVLLGGTVGTWLLWPRSEEWYFTRAVQLMEAEDDTQWQQAKDRYLVPMLKEFPNGKHRDAAQAYIDQVDMANAEKGMRLRARVGLEPRSEGERLYAEASRFEKFGDRITALEQYESMIHLLADKESERPYVNLARRQKQLIEKTGEARDRARFIQERMDMAEELAAKGERIEARKIWSSIVQLYENNREFASFVAEAQARIEGKPAGEVGKSD